MHVSHVTIPGVPTDKRPEMSEKASKQNNLVAGNKGNIMFKNKLNSTIAKVTSFITDLETGIKENEAAIAKNDTASAKLRGAAKTQAAEISAKAAVKASKVTAAASVKSGKVIGKASAKAVLTNEETSALRDQNEVARKLLSRLS